MTTSIVRDWLKLGLALTLQMLGVSHWGMAQTGELVNAEYFFDTDPGHGNGMALSVPSGLNLSQQSSISVSGLAEGAHMLYVRVLDDYGIWSTTVAQPFYKTADASASITVEDCEYFWDTDPGWGNGGALTLSSGASIEVSQSLDVSSLSTGFHILYARCQDSRGLWSMCNIQTVYKIDETAFSEVNIDRMEYFWDSDPGHGNGTGIDVPDNTVQTLATSIDVSALSPGFHAFYARFRDADGNWSHTIYQPMYVLQKPAGTTAPLTQWEYFWDTDPGPGNGQVSTLASNDFQEIATTLDVSALSIGFHRLYARFKDTNNNWSKCSIQTIYKIDETKLVPVPMVGYEYFFDTDSGTGTGTYQTISSGTTYHGNTIYADVSALEEGSHLLYWRMKDNLGRWSITQNTPFYKSTAPDAVNIDRLEYFADTISGSVDGDPGYGNAQALDVGDGVVVDTSFEAVLTGLDEGFYKVCVRAQDVNGLWSQTVCEDFEIASVALPIELLSFSLILKKEGYVLIKWQTLTETNNDFFTVERSKDADDWESLVELKGAGNSTEMLSYETLDEHPLLGTSYYRLKQTDFNGDYAYFGILDFELTQKYFPQTKAYPNPTQGLLTLEGREEDITSYQFYDVQGKEMNGQVKVVDRGKGFIQLDISDFLSGMYILETTHNSFKVRKE